MKKYFKYLIIITILLILQALTYFVTKQLIHEYHIMKSFIDVPLIKPFIYAYNSWYPFLVISTFLVFKYENKLFRPLIYTIIFVDIMALITFFIYPTEMVRPEIVVNDFTTWLIDFTYKSDTPAVNCLPSLHCILTFICIFYVMVSKNIKWYKKIILFIIATLIVLSTVFIKQHIVEDIILAFIYSVIGIFIIYKNRASFIRIIK